MPCLSSGLLPRTAPEWKAGDPVDLGEIVLAPVAPPPIAATR